MKRLAISCLVLAGIALPAAAQQQRFELTPTVGYRWGGGIVIDEDALKHGRFDVDMTGEASLGLKFGFFVSRNFELELMAAFQQAELKDDQGLFGEDPGWVYPPGATGQLDVDVFTWQVGLLWHLLPGDTRPYLLVAAGQSRIDPRFPLPDDTVLSLGLGGGVKTRLSDRLGLRFELRYIRNDTSPSVLTVQQLEHRDCTGSCTYTWRYDDTLDQFELSLGLIVRF